MNGRMEGNLKAVGNGINCTEEAFTLGRTAGPTMASTLKIKSRDLGFILGQMGRGMRDNG